MNPQTTMNQQSALDQLADIHLPEAPGYWPLAPGWWIVIACLCASLIALVFWLRFLRKNRYRKLALKELDRIYAEVNRNQDVIAYLTGVNELLKRTALTAYSSTGTESNNKFVASIKGAEWLAWLDKVCPATQQAFTQSLAYALTQAPYQSSSSVKNHLNIDLQQIQQLCKTWVLKHKPLHRIKPQHITLSAEAK